MVTQKKKSKSVNNRYAPHKLTNKDTAWYKKLRNLVVMFFIGCITSTYLLFYGFFDIPYTLFTRMHSTEVTMTDSFQFGLNFKTSEKIAGETKWKNM